MKKNKQVVLIMTDTQRWDMLGCYGRPELQTPCLDQLAATGMRFERAYTCQPVCGPARSAIFTGTFPHTNGSWANSMALADNVQTVGQRLRDNGVHAAYIGKWHLDGSDYFGLGRCPDGWDPEYWYDMRNYLEELPEADRRRSRSAAIMYEGDGIQPEFTFAHRCTERATRFLEKHTDQDFFLTVSYDEPHHPSLCPKPYIDLFQDYELPKSPNVWDTLENKPEHQRIWAGDTLAVEKDDLRIKQPAFLGCNAFVDSQIGRVLTAIDQYAPEALVIYTSDHGEAGFSHSLGQKGPTMYDEVARVPFIVRWPGVTAPGSVCPHPTSHIDIVPTILDAFALNRPKVLEGKSMRASLADSTQATNREIFCEFGRFEIGLDIAGGFQPLRGVFDGRYKLVINLMVTDELYDLQSDPGELNNLIESPEHVDIRNGLHDKLLDWMNRTRDPFRGYYWERRPWRRDARPATWSYTGMERQPENEEDEPRQLDYNTGLPISKPVRSRI